MFFRRRLVDFDSTPVTTQVAGNVTTVTFRVPVCHKPAEWMSKLALLRIQNPEVLIILISDGPLPKEWAIAESAFFPLEFKVRVEDKK